MTKKEAEQLAAQAWCEPDTSKIEMDVRLAFAFSRILLREVRKAKEAEAAKWRDDDSPEAECGYGVCRGSEKEGIDR